MNHRFPTYLFLLGVNLIYACTSIFTKMASQSDFLSLPYILWLAGAVGVMAVYAVLWQQIIKRMDLSVAYMFKGTSLLFVLLLSVMLFGETITVCNVIGAALIVGGIVIYAQADEKSSADISTL
jgi:drug/metabolite transporter (DMT)-like permease